MTPDELNALLDRIVEALRSDASVANAELITRADDQGTAPEIALTVAGVDLFLTVGIV